MQRTALRAAADAERLDGIEMDGDTAMSAFELFPTPDRTVRRSWRQPRKAAIVLIAIGVIACPAAYASDPMPRWADKWSAHVWNTYCELHLDYIIPFREDTKRRGFLAGRSIDRLFARFAASTRTHFGLIPEDTLFRIRFQLLFYGEAGHPVPMKDQILSARIDELAMASQPDQNDWILTFGLDENDTSSLLQRLRENRTVEIVVQFADGEERRSKIYRSGDRDFHIWEAMFRTCIRENVD